MKNVLPTVAFAILAFVIFLYASPLIALAPAGVSFYYFLQCVKADQASTKASNDKLNEAGEDLRQAILDTHILVLTTMPDASLELQHSVLEYLVDAGEHLGNPDTNSRVVYGETYFLNWTKEGLDKVNRARNLIDAFQATKKEAALAVNERKGNLTASIQIGDKDAINAAIGDSARAIAFYFWHSHTTPSLTEGKGWVQDLAAKCVDMGFKVTLDTIDNPDQEGLDENYKSIVYISR